MSLVEGSAKFGDIAGHENEARDGCVSTLSKIASKRAQFYATYAVLFYRVIVSYCQFVSYFEYELRPLRMRRLQKYYDIKKSLSLQYMYS